MHKTAQKINKEVAANKNPDLDEIDYDLLVRPAPKKGFTISFDMAVFDANIDDLLMSESTVKKEEVKGNVVVKTSRRCVIL